MPTQLPTEQHWMIHILPFCRCALCDFFHDIFLILECWLVFPSAKAASFIWAEVSSSSFLLAFASPHLLRLFLLFFLYESFTWPRKFTPACRRIEKHRSFSRFTGFRYSILRPFEHDVEILNLIQGFAWSAMLMLFDVSLLFTLRHSYRKIMFKTGLLWPLDFRVDSDRKWRPSARYYADNVEVKTFSLIPLHIVKYHSRYPTEIPLLISFILIFIKDKMPVCVADFASLQVLVECRQNVPKWAGKLWSLIVKTLNLIGPQNMLLSPVWTASCKRR